MDVQHDNKNYYTTSSMTNVSVYLNILYINYIFRRLIFMNEGILIAYDDTYYSIGDTLVIQKRLTDILKPCGMRYFTGRSLYKPEDPDRRDDIMYDAMKLLSQCEWIDNKNELIFVIDDIISISLINIENQNKIICFNHIMVILLYRCCDTKGVSGHYFY